MKKQIIESLQKMLTKRIARTQENSRGIMERKLPNAKPVYCNDGVLSMSVQASRLHYSTPRTDEGPYTHVEVGFPSVKPPQSWAEYCDGDFETKPCDTVYAYVPLELVAEFIELHGGLKTSAPVTILPKESAPIKRDAAAQRLYNITLEDMGFKV